MNENKIAKEGTGGGKVTNEMCEYHVKNTNIVLYDTPGCETGGELEKVKDELIKEIKKLEKIKEKFYCIIYLLSHNDARDIDKPEEALVDNLLQLKAPF